MEQRVIELELRVKYLENKVRIVQAVSDLLKNELVREKESHLSLMKDYLQTIASINNSTKKKRHQKKEEVNREVK